MASATPVQSAFFDLIEPLVSLANELGLDVQITTRTSEGIEAEEANDEERRKRKVSDYGWFQTLLARDKDTEFLYSGNYVAVHNQSIISFGSDANVTRVAAANVVGVDPEEILVLPVGVRDPDADQFLENVKASLHIS